MSLLVDPHRSGGVQQEATAFVPNADIEETADAYLVELDLPGVDPADIDVELDGRWLTVSGRRRDDHVGEFRRRTRSVGAFRYRVELPCAAVVVPVVLGDHGEAATLVRGVLTVRVPRTVYVHVGAGTRSRHLRVT